MGVVSRVSTAESFPNVAPFGALRHAVLEKIGKSKVVESKIASCTLAMVPIERIISLPVRKVFEFAE